MKSLKTILPVAAAGILCSLPTFAFAQQENDAGLYLGGGIGYERIESEDFPNSEDEFENLSDNRVAYKGIAGFRFNRMFSIEGQYVDFGDAADGPLSVEADGWTAGLVVDIPVTERISPYGKIGMLFWDAEASVDNVPGSVSDDGNDVVYGVGVRFGLAENLDLRLEYERYTFSVEDTDTDVDLASANLQFNF